ncbi:MAG: hypothetical protein K6G33_01085 [Ruminococcus sp.]|uniref:hypothetical protein n=1 Tax=Ruminococcus sp. TaxID=41978 RepID=UPI002600A131|nr:hypothetical protein [Ruminococcus sp.]MCR5599327.1 hypothetical protein [Ruminococcus sp.]
MAFIELTEDEITLLDDSQKEQYNRELKLYRERVALVEKLVQIENANFQYVKPEFKSIKPVRRVDVPEYIAAEKVRVALPDDIAQVKEIGSKGKENSLLRQQMIGRILQNVRIADIPNVKVPLPDSVEYSGIGNYEIDSIEGVKVKVDAPELNVQPIGRSVISELTETVKINAPKVSFEFERDAVSVETVKTELPQIAKYTGIDAVDIKNFPDVAVKAAPKLSFEYSGSNEETLLGIEKMVADVQKAPEVSFEMEPVTIGEIERPVITGIDTSELNKRLDIYKTDIIEPVNLQLSKPSVPDIGEYEEPDIELAMPQTEQVSVPDITEYEKPDIELSMPQVERVSVPDIKGYEEPDIEISMPQIEDISVPEVGGFVSTTMEMTDNIEMPELELPEYNVSDYVFAGVSDIPKISVESPCCSDNDFNDVMQKIINSMQGA